MELSTSLELCPRPPEGVPAAHEAAQEAVQETAQDMAQETVVAIEIVAFGRRQSQARRHGLRQTDRFLLEATRQYQEGHLDQPLWDRAIAQTNGDEEPAVEIYLRARATALRLLDRERRMEAAATRATLAELDAPAIPKRPPPKVPRAPSAAHVRDVPQRDLRCGSAGERQDHAARLACRRAVRDDRATIFEDPTGVRILYDAGESVTGGDDPRLGDVHVVLLSHAHGDHIGDMKLKALEAGTCDSPELVSAAPNSTTAEIAAAKNAAVIMSTPMGIFIGKKIETIRGKPTGACPQTGENVVAPFAAPCLAAGQHRRYADGEMGNAARAVEITVVTASHDSTVPRSLLTDPENKISTPTTSA